MQIKKTPHIIKRLAEVAPSLKEFVDYLESCPFDELIVKIQQFGKSKWDRPRGDLCAWIPVLNRFDLILEGLVGKYELDVDYPKPIEVSPEDEYILVNVLQFSSFLLEKCSNRGIYASIKHLACLLNAISPAIVASALRVSVQLAHRFAQSRTGKGNVTAIEPEKIFKLATLLPTSHWETPDKKDIAYVDYIADNGHEWNEEWLSFSIQYYVRGKGGAGAGVGSGTGPGVPANRLPNTPFQPNTPTRYRHSDTGSSSLGTGSASAGTSISTPSSAAASVQTHTTTANVSNIVPVTSSEGLSTLTISPGDVKSLSLIQLLQKLHSVLPQESYFLAACKARLAKACSDPNSNKSIELRRQLCKIQFYALAFACCTFSETTVDSRIISKAPSLIRQIGSLISPKNSTIVGTEFSILALETLDFVCHQPARRSDVLGALSANVAHGVLMTIVRNIIRDLQNDDSNFNEEYACRVFKLILQLAFTQSLGAILVTTGLVQLLLEIIQIKTRYVRTLASAMELLDQVIIDISSTFSTFSQSGGIGVLIDVIKREIQYDLDVNSGVVKQEEGEVVPDYCVVDYSLSFHRSQWIRSLFVVVSNILVHTRTTENIHNLVDSPLLQASKLVISNPSIFGSRVVSLNLQILSSMLENEPSSFGIMHEAKLVDSVLNQVPTLLEKSFSYFSPIAKLIGALSHNENGIKLIQERNMIGKFIESLANSITKNESLPTLGPVFEGLTSDHTELRKQVVSESRVLLRDLSRLLEPVSDSSKFYCESEPTNINGSGSSEQDVNDIDIDQSEGTSINAGNTATSSVDNATPLESPEIVVVVGYVVAFFDGLLKNHLTRVQFIKQKGVSDLLSIFEIPNLPYDFAFSSVGYTLGRILRSLFTLDIDSDLIQYEIIERIEKKLSQVEEQIAMVDLQSQIVRDDVNLDDVQRSLVTLNGLLQAFFQMVFYDYGTGYRVNFVLDKIVEKRFAENLITRLAAIQRWCIWQESRSLDGLSNLFIEATRPLSVDITRNETEDYKKIKEAEARLEDSESKFFINVKAFRFIANANSIMSSKIFSEFAAICTNDRAMSSRRKNGLKMADLIATAMIDHLDFEPLTFQFGNDDMYQQAKLHTLIGTLAVLQKVMFKSWNSTLAAYLGVFVMFKQQRGLQKLLLLLANLWDIQDGSAAVIESSNNSASDATSASSLLLFAQKVILMFLGYTISHRSILENGRLVSPLSTRDSHFPTREVFNPKQFFVECRIIVLNSLQPLWESDNLETKDFQISQLFLDMMTKLFSFSGEDGADKGPRERLPKDLSWKNVCPSEYKVESLTDIGFDESEARSALKDHDDDEIEAFEYLEEHGKKGTNAIPLDSFICEAPSNVGVSAPISSDGKRLVLLSDLNELRDSVKSKLIDRTLNLIQSHPKNVFTAAQLIIKAHSSFASTRSEREREALTAIHKDIVTTILQALSSCDTDSEEHHGQITPVCHFLGLILQDGPFFQSCFEDLVESIDLFISLLEFENAHEQEWYPSVLLIIERIITNVSVPDLVEAKFDTSNLSSSFDAFKTILPKIPKETEEKIFQLLSKPTPFKTAASALATARLYVFFSKDPDRANLLKSTGLENLLRSVLLFGDSPNLEKLETAILIVLRQTIETKESIKKYMIKEIKAWFSPQRLADAAVFIKSHVNLVCRSPEIFIEVASELLTLQDPTLSSSNLCLKEYLAKKRKKTLQIPKRLEDSDEEDREKERDKDGTSEENDLKDEKVAVSTSNETDKDDTADTKEDILMTGSETPGQANKFPTLTYSSGVINLILSELFKMKSEQLYTLPLRTEESLLDYTSKNKAEPAFKYSEHKPFIYAYFLLKILIELLGSYNQCKLEFFNFSTKAQLSTPMFTNNPTKPKPHVLLHLIHEYLAIGVVNGPQNTTPVREWTSISGLASSVIQSLLTSTGEADYGSTNDDIQNEPVIIFVRKFTLDIIAKTLKEIHSTTTSLDWKYSLLSTLSELCYRLLANRPGFSSSGPSNDIADGAAIAKIMYDKKFASLFSVNIGMVDLNYPHVKKVVKLDLRFLHKLSRLALDISDQLNTDNGQDNLEEEDYDSDLDIREDTPDLFRNSTLGMFEVGDPMYDDDEELEEDEVIQSQDSDEMDYDDVNDEVLSDVEDDVSEANESIDYDEDDDEEESDESDVDDDGEDDGMGVEIIVESQDEDEDQDMEIEVEGSDEADWESYDEDDEEGELIDDFPNELDDDAAVNALEELSGRRMRNSDRSLGVFGEEDGDDVIYSTRQPIMEDGHREYSSDDDGEDEDEDEESIDIDYEDDPDSYFEFNNAFSRLVPGGIRIDGRRHGHGHGDTVSNPLLSQPSSTPRLTIPRTIHSDGMSDLSAQLRNASASGGPPQDILSAILGQFMGVFGGQDRGLDIGQIGISQHGSTMETILPSGFQGFHRVDRHGASGGGDSIYNITHANPVSTLGRWQEASRMFEVFERTEISGRVLIAIFNNIVPYAIEEEKKAKEIEKEIKIILDENRRKREEREKRRREKEEEERRKKEEEEAAAAAAAEAARREEEEAAAAAAAATEAESAESNDSTMDQDEEPNASDEPRVFVSISGRDIDITGLGIDPTFLEALPADIREEAFTQHIRELRASGSDSATREIEPEFLEALPENIRDELMAQEALDRRTSQLLEVSGSSGGNGEMDLASFLATLDPSLRQTVLLEQGEEALSSLPREIAQEAHELRSRTIASFSQPRTTGSSNGTRPRTGSSRHHLRQNFNSVFGYDGESDFDEREMEEHEHLLESTERKLSKKVLSAAALHLVDRSGIAALVRLLYLPQNVNQREQLHELLFNLCSNKQSRTDILNIIIHVLQDGSADSHSLERGFLQISHRAVSGKEKEKDNNGQPGKLINTPKTPNFTPHKLTGNSSGFLSLNEDISPVIVTQQVLEALEYLVRYSGRVKYFFLCEHDFPIGFKRHSKGKSKGKEKERDKEGKFPINILIYLLDRPVVYENNLTLELLSSLIQEVTRSLPIVLKESSKEEGSKEKEKKTAEGGDGIEEHGEDEGLEGKITTSEDTKRTHKLIDAPYIPEKNLKRISSILTAKECSSRTFQQTLAVMHNLCAISGVRDLFGRELLEQAISVGPSLIYDLKELLNRVEMAEKGSDLQGDTLAKFSSGSSDQTKLLRVLTAIDYLFNPSKDEKDSKDSKPKDNDATIYLKSLYEKMTFGPLWGALSDCLRLIQDRQDMIHVATALLPLIEALMVICKNSRVKDVELRDHNRYEAKKYDIATEPLESLFFSFTDEHRKILNQMVRNNPKLMSGSFSILIKNSKALEFDNKRRYFYRRIYNNNQNPTGTISIHVRRDQVFLDSYKSLYFKSASEIKNSRFNIRFQGEEGVDAGGVTREWYQVLSRQIFNPDYALFSPVASDSTTFHPNRTSWVNPEHLSFFKFIGRIIGKAIYDFKLLDCHFSRAVYKKILGKPVSIKDMETLDLDYYKSLVWMMENDITDIITETFSIEAEDYGEQKIIDLKPGGRDIPVTEENKHEYVRLVVDYRLIKSVQEQLDHFLEGK